MFFYQGMLSCLGKNALMMDADGATRISDMDALETAIGESSENYVAFGSRAVGSDTTRIERSWFRRFLMNGFHLLVMVVLGTFIRDTQCGFKMFRREAARDIFLQLHLEGWAADLEVVILASRLGYNVIEIPVSWTEIPGSKINLAAAAVQMVRDMIAIRILYVFGIWKALRLPNAP
eukprot:GHVU01216395.1.p1 GENE.GHVU01216395.1~~GHVU01216395.1.p1  ORF type:complete len:177 (+),score=19.49 GHVU01216395.1:591-1121(+)